MVQALARDRLEGAPAAGPHPTVSRHNPVPTSISEIARGLQVPPNQVSASLHVRVLLQVPVFAGAFTENAPRHAEFCADIAAFFTTRTISKGEMFIRKGDPGNEMYLIAGGLVGIHLKLEDDSVATLQGGDIVGEGSLFSGAHMHYGLIRRRNYINDLVWVFAEEMRTAYVVAHQRTEVLVLSRAALNRVLPRYPRVRLEMEAFLEGRLCAIILLHSPT